MNRPVPVTVFLSRRSWTIRTDLDYAQPFWDDPPEVLPRRQDVPKTLDAYGVIHLEEQGEQG